MTNRNLFDLFAPYGNVISARIMVERETGRSRGFGCVVCLCC
jgi:CUG-BP- and ETR3-like factor